MECALVSLSGFLHRCITRHDVVSNARRVFFWRRRRSGDDESERKRKVVGERDSFFVVGFGRE